MSRPILVGAESNAYDAAVLLFTEDIGTLFVGKKDDIQGVVSRKDLLKAAMGRDDLAKVPISMVMTSRSKMIYAEPKEDLVSIAQKMMDYEVDCLPVGTFKNVGNDRKFVLIGRVSKTNITVSFWNWERRQKIINGKTTAGLCRSDSLGETAESVAKATIGQYDTDIEIHRVPFIRHTDQIEKLLMKRHRRGCGLSHTGQS